MTKLGVNIDHSATLRQARYRECLDNKEVIIEKNELITENIADKIQILLVTRKA